MRFICPSGLKPLWREDKNELFFPFKLFRMLCKV